jgi:multidrug resistance efflux pump
MENPKKSIFTRPWIQSLSGIIIIGLIVFGILFYKSISSYINIDNASISSPIISIAPQSQGILDEVYVKEGDKVTKDEPLARVDAEILKSKVAGTIVYINNAPGQVFNSAQPVVKMVDPKESKLLAIIKEDSGLSKIAVGNPVSFILDAFPNIKYTGLIEEISPTSNDSSVVFNISDTRVVKEYTVKINYDVAANPEFKNGMSAKIKIYYK